MKTVLAAALALVGVADAAPHRSPPPPASLDDACVDPACHHHALDHFRAALGRARAGKADHAVRVSYFGDSLTADDHITHALRTKLAGLIGDGGPGFVWAAPPHPYCQHRAVTATRTKGWRSYGISTIVPRDHLLGLGGSAEGDGTIRWKSTAPIASVDVHYLAQPRGGSFEIVADKTTLAEVSTAADAKRAAFRKVDVPAGTTRIELRARGRVRLFGAALEAAKGAVVDNLGVVNATAKQLATHDQPDHLRGQLAHRASDLVIVMLGTNEAEWLPARGTAMAEHERLMGELLATVRAANPAASCLVVSPLDQLDWRTEGAPPRASIPAMVAAQHRAATAHGCAFWDVYRWMGGKGASRTWHRRGLVANDFQHPTPAGAERLAAALFAGLTRK